MNLLDQLETSYNRQVQKRIFAQLDRIDAAWDLYLGEKYRHRILFRENTKDLFVELKREKALLKGYRQDFRDELRKLRRDYLNKVFELKENRDFGLKENKQYVKLIMAKIDANYRKAKAGIREAAKLREFEEKFREYRAQELGRRREEQKQKKEKILSEYCRQFQELTDSYEKKRNALLERHRETPKKVFRKEKMELIRTLEAKIDAERKQMREAEARDEEKVEKLRRDYFAVKKEAQAEIRSIKLEAKEKVSRMSPEEREVYRELQKYIREDFRLRRLKRFDSAETKIFRRLNPAYLYVTPAFLSAMLFTLFPFIFMIVGSFFRINFTNLRRSKFVGLDNFINIFTKDTEFQKALGNTAIYALITIVLLTVVTVAMAAWLAKNTRIHNLTQTMVFTPHIASLVSISILWIAMLHPTGIVNKFLALFGIQGPAWLLQENTSLFSVSLVTVWKDIGYYVLIIISGLQGIPAYVYEAALLDKASKSTTFFKITLPLLAPTMSFVFLTKFINSFKVFAPIEIMTNGGPMGSSMVLSYWIYKVGRIGFNYGTAMAGAIVLTLMICICTLLKNLYFDRVVDKVVKY